MRYAQSRGQVEVITELEWRRDRVPLAEYEAFRRWINEADALLRERVRIGGAR
ncbi:MAG: hypothetical protein M5U28_48625 [Sandaracinaceae bacterium]|nr:hypothetical protein [Sandaracinaceae bacterium]